MEFDEEDGFLMTPSPTVSAGLGDDHHHLGLVQLRLLIKYRKMCVMTETSTIMPIYWMSN